MKNTQFKKDNILLAIIFLGFILRLELMISEGSSLFLYSDDLSYIEGAINFNKTGYLTYSNKLNQTVLDMPGMFLIISFIFKIFGHAGLGLSVLKLLFIGISVYTIYAINICTNKIFKNELVGYLSSFFVATNMSLIYLSNLFLTETIALFILVSLTNKILDFCDDKSNKNFILVILWHLFCIMICPNFILYPLAFLPLMLYKKFSLKELFLRGLYASLIILMVLTPWTVRNYIITGDIIPLTGNQGDKKLLGTFRGEGFPDGSYDDYIYTAASTVNYDRAPDGETIGINPYYYIKERGILADERIEEWKANGGYYKTVLLDNPIKLLKNQFIPSQYSQYEYNSSILEKLFNISYHIDTIFAILLIFALIGIASIFIQLKSNKEVFFKCISMTLGFIIILYINASYIALTRYGVQNILIVSILAGQGVYCARYMLYKVLKKDM